MNISRAIYPLMILLLLAVNGCAGLKDVEDQTLDWPAQKLYSTAKAALQNKDYEGAIKYYQLLQARYPFGRFAQQAQLEVGYAYYQSDEPESAIVTLDRFLELYPRHAHADYAYYLKGLVNFNRGKGFVERLLPKDESQRDPGAARDSFADFVALVKKYPTSRYAPDARQRLIHLRNRLAWYEIHAADFYLRRGTYMAAANRAEYIIRKFPRTPAVADALSLLGAAYQNLQLEDLSGDAIRVLALNYPDHPGIKEPGSLAPQEKSTWWEWLGLDK